MEVIERVEDFESARKCEPDQVHQLLSPNSIRTTGPHLGHLLSGPARKSLKLYRDHFPAHWGLLGGISMSLSNIACC